jgi:energy-coupling factor transporter ATP-binding protein EcfA2
MIRAVSVSNFKAIGARGLTLQLAPLTLLVGPNGAGKSTLLEATALLAQSARPHARFGLLADGRLVSLDSRDGALYHMRRTSVPLRIEVEWQELRAPHPVAYWLEVEGATEVRSGEWRQGLRYEGESLLFFKKRMEGTAFSTMAEMSGGVSASFAVCGSVERVLDEGLFAGPSLTELIGLARGGEDLANRPPNTWPMGPQPVEPAAPPVTGPARSGAPPLQELAAWKTIADNLAEYLTSSRLRFSSALRGGLLTSYETKGEPEAVGPHGFDTIRLLGRLQAKGGRERKEWFQQLAARFGMTDLSVGYERSERLACLFEDPELGCRLPLLGAGFGSQQALPVLADLADSEPGTTLLLEEVEHSCHPAWVKTWAETLAEGVAKRDLQVIATTHAPDLVLAIGLAVRKGLVPATSVAVFELRRSEGVVTAVHCPLDERGRFESGWIESFAAAERELLGELLDDESG